MEGLFSFPFLLVVVWCICWCWGLGSRQFEPSYSWSSAALVVMPPLFSGIILKSARGRTTAVALARTAGGDGVALKFTTVSIALATNYYQGRGRQNSMSASKQSGANEVRRWR